MAEEHNLVAVILHHESKGYVGTDRSTASAGRAALGAMSWRAQADLHLAVELPQNPREPRQTTADGLVIERYRVRLRLPKVRDFGEENAVEDVVIESEKRNGALLAMRVLSEVVKSSEPKPRAEQRMLDALAAMGETTTAQLAAALEVDPSSGSFKRALHCNLDSGQIVKVAHGRYAVKGEA